MTQNNPQAQPGGLSPAERQSTLIRSARLDLGLTQQKLGEHLGYTGENAQRYVYDWEAGRRMVPRDKLQKLAELLHLDPMQLL